VNELDEIALVTSLEKHYDGVYCFRSHSFLRWPSKESWIDVDLWEIKCQFTCSSLETSCR